MYGKCSLEKKKITQKGVGFEEGLRREYEDLHHEWGFILKDTFRGKFLMV